MSDVSVIGGDGGDGANGAPPGGRGAAGGTGSATTATTTTSTDPDNAAEAYGGNGGNGGNGGAGQDTLIGAGGDDIYLVDDVADVVREAANAGTGMIRATIGVALGDTVETLSLLGGGAINGTGSALANVIVANANANLIAGNGAADMLAGGGGADTFVYRAASDSTTSAADVMTDFQNGADKLDLSALRTGGDSFTIASSGRATIVSVDPDGNGSVDSPIRLTGASAIATGDAIWGMTPTAHVATRPRSRMSSTRTTSSTPPCIMPARTICPRLSDRRRAIPRDAPIRGGAPRASPAGWSGSARPLASEVATRAGTSGC